MSGEVEKLCCESMIEIPCKGGKKKPPAAVAPDERNWGLGAGMNGCCFHYLNCIHAWPLQKENREVDQVLGELWVWSQLPLPACLCEYLLFKEMYLCTLYISHFSPSKRIEPPAICSCCLSFGKSLSVSGGQKTRHSDHQFPALSGR